MLALVLSVVLVFFWLLVLVSALRVSPLVLSLALCVLSALGLGPVALACCLLLLPFAFGFQVEVRVF